MAEQQEHEPILRLSLLGTVRVETPEGAVQRSDVGGRRPLEVLVLLALAGAKPVSKEAMALALWPEAMPRSAYATIESYVSVLRRVLFRHRADARRVLETTASGYRLALDEVDLDLVTFDRALRAADDALSVRSEVEIRRLASVIPRGELAEDLGAVEWVEADRRLYHDRVVRNRQSLAEARLQVADFAGAIRDAEEVLRLEPFAEAAYRVKMLGYYALGQEESARLAFDQCRCVLATELGRDCTTVTESLAAAIDAGEAPSRILWSLRTGWASEVPISASVGGVAPGERRNPRGRIPFVGRSSELEQLRELVTVATRGSMRVGVVTGASGSGRSAVLQRLQEAFPLISGSTSYRFADIELRQLPLAEALLDALVHRGDDHLVEPYIGGPFIGNPDACFAALADLLHRAGPLLLLLDDLDLADRGTIRAITWLRHHAADAPVAIVASSHALPRLQRTLIEELPVDLLVPLRPLDATAVASLGPLAERVRALCGGNAGLMADLWRWVAIGGSGVPASIRRSVHARVRALGELQREALITLALARDITTTSTLAHALRRGHAEIVDLVDGLHRLGLVELRGPGVRFAQPVVRDVVAAAALAGESRDDDDGGRPLLVS